MTPLALKSLLRRVFPGKYLAVNVSYDDCYGTRCYVSLSVYPDGEWKMENCYRVEASDVETACELIYRAAKSGQTDLQYDDRDPFPRAPQQPASPA